MEAKKFSCSDSGGSRPSGDGSTGNCKATRIATDYINYAGPPTVNPPALLHIVVDVNGRQWQFVGGTWN